MLGTVDGIGPRDDGDINPRRLGAVVLVSGLMMFGIGAGMLLTGTGDRGNDKDVSIVNVPRLRHDRPVPPPAAPVAGTPALPAVPPQSVVPAPPHPVEIGIAGSEPVAPHVYPRYVPPAPPPVAPAPIDLPGPLPPPAPVPISE